MAPIAPLPLTGALLVAALVWLLQYALGAPVAEWRTLSVASDTHVMSIAGTLRNGEPVLVAGGRDGRVFERIGSEDWTQATVVENLPVIRLAFGKTLLAATGDGVYHRTAADGWQPLDRQGLGGRRVADVIAEPFPTYATDGERVFRLTADGWTVLPRHGLPELPLYRLAAADSPNGWILHAGTVGDGVYSRISDADNGSWRANNAGLPDGAKVFSLLQLPRGGLVAGTDQGVFRQSEPFASWQPLGQLLQPRRVLALAYDTEYEQLWAGTDNAIYRAEGSPDDPRFAWRLVPSAAPFDAPVSHVTAEAGTAHAAAGSLYRLGERRQLRPLQWVAGIVAALAAYLTFSMPRIRRR